MTVISDRIHGLEAWIDGYSRTPPHVMQFRLRSETSDSADIIKVLRDAAKEHLADRCEKGVYVWFWPECAERKLWPLYVGKSQRGRSCFLARTNAHLSHAFRGVDSLYARENNVGESGFHRTHQAGTPLSIGHSCNLFRQFNGMRILFLPMNEDDARELAGKAEALILSAVLRWHDRPDSNRTEKERWDGVMNSSGRTLTCTDSDVLIRSAMSALGRWFSLDPSREAGTRIGRS